MRKRRRTRWPAIALTGAVLTVCSTARASAGDPSSNFAPNQACGTAAACLAAAINSLDQARERLGEPAYRLPANFSQLAPDEQAFVLTNLDRTLYGLAPIPGLTGQLDQVAATAVRLDADPSIGATDIMTSTSNWGGGYRNLPFAYEAWMYDDGLGGVNLDCTPLNRRGCWAHRHNVLWSFSGRGPLAMGAAAGSDPRGMPSDALIIVQGDSGYRPDYRYTWSQALAAGAGAGAGAPSPPPAQPATANHLRGKLKIRRLRVRPHTVSFQIISPTGTSVGCSLSRVHAARSRGFHRCGPDVAYRHLRPGAYRLRLRAERSSLRRTIRVP